MINRVLDLSDRPARLSVRNSLLVIQFASAPVAKTSTSDDASIVDRRVYPSEHEGDPNEFTIPLADIGVLIVSHPQVSYSHAVLSGIAVSGAVFVTCNEKHMPVSMLLPLVSHSLQAERFGAQAKLPVPVQKRAWQQIVQAKILAQGRLLKERTDSDQGLIAIAKRVRSGDTANVEARAARIYWGKLFGEREFRRDSDGDGLNACLNYGYAVLRAVVARSLCGAGLHPSLGIHHHNRYDAFCLADDLMEPFRPLVDREVAKLQDDYGDEVELDKKSKQVMLGALLGRFIAENESRTLFDWISISASSLASVMQGSDEKLELPVVEIDKQQPQNEN